MENSVRFQDLFNEGMYEDLAYLCDGKLTTEDNYSFDIHRVMLARDNKYFRALFRNISKGREAVLIPGIRGEVLNQILYYIYTGTIHLSHENICELLFASDYLLVDNLMHQIKKYSEDCMSANNCFPIYTAALEINHEDLRKLSYRYIQTNFETLVYNDAADFGELSLECLKQFLNDSNLCVRGEHTVWMAILKWIFKDLSSRLCTITDLIKCLKISDIDESLANEILHHEMICNNSFCNDLKNVKSHSHSVSNLDVLKKYFSERTSVSLELPVYDIHRCSHCLHLIARYFVHNLTDGVQLYLTYDENVDIWRQLVELDFCPTFLSVIGFNVYMFDSFNNSNIIFNMREKQWTGMKDFRVPRFSYRLITLEGAIYILGGESALTGENIMSVEYYIPEMDMWFHATPMLSVASFAAVSFRSRIFVVGKSSDELSFRMVAQVYCKDDDEWTAFEAPNIFRFDFAFAEYHDKLYIVGGSDGSQLIKKVEVFDFETNSWQMTTELPYSYYLPKAIAFNDQLIVFDCLLEDPNYLKKSPPLRWNENEQSWEPLEKPLPLKDIALYLFSTVKDTEIVNFFVKENRNPIYRFEKSPFN